MQLTKSQESALKYDKNILVEAGAGSGKTAVFVLRYLKLLEDHPDLSPQHILAITFTNKAAQECKERIQHHIIQTMPSPSDWLKQFSDAYISTIHGFCSKLVKSHALSLSISPHFSVIDEQDRAYFFHIAIKNTIHQLSQQNNTALRHYCHTFSISRLYKDLDTCFSHQDWFFTHYNHIKHLHSTSLHDELIRSLGLIFEQTLSCFNRLLEQLGAFTYDDLFYNVQRLLQINPIRAALQEQFKFIMVDECQDIDPAQWDVIQQIISDIDPLKQSKLFFVGDAKQSIYGFRGADLNFFSNLSSQFSAQSTTCSRVVLSDNFRTAPSIVAFLNPLFHTLFQGQSNLRYNPLIAYRCDHGHTQALLLKDGISAIDESNAIASWIHTFLKHHPQYTFSDIAILVRQRKQLYFFKEQFDALGIPVHLDREPGFFQQDVVIDLFHVMKILCLPNDLLAWMSVLKSPFFGFNADMLHIVLTETSSSRFLDKLIDCSKWTKDDCIKFNLSDNDQFLLKKAVDYIPSWISKRHDLDLIPLLKTLLEDTGAISLYVSQLDQNKHFIDQFLAVVGDLDSQPHLSRFELIERLEFKLHTTQTTLPAPSTNDHCVQLMTIHSSKGLEFPIVICPQLHHPFSVHKSSSLLLGADYIHLSTDDPLSKDTRKQIFSSLMSTTIEEEKRLFYVACTRAKDALLLSGLIDSKHYKKPCYLSFLFDTYHLDHSSSSLLSNNNNQPIDVTVYTQCSQLPVTQFTHASNKPALTNTSQIIQPKFSTTPAILETSLSKLEQSLTPTDPTLQPRSLSNQLTSQVALYNTANFGILVHKMIRDLLEIGPFNDSFFVPFIQRSFTDPAHKQPIISQLNTHFTTCLRSEFLKSLLAFPARYEQPFSLFTNYQFVRGRFDSVFFRDTDILILDFKTMSFKDKDASDILSTYQTQLSIYHQAGEALFSYRNKPVVCALFSTLDSQLIFFEPPSTRP